MAKRRLLTLKETKNNYIGNEELYNFGIDLNGNDKIEEFIFKALKDMHKNGVININKVHNLIDYEYSLSINNISMNLKNPILNISDNLILIKEKNNEV
jgi:hypothetical protein